MKAMDLIIKLSLMAILIYIVIHLFLIQKNTEKIAAQLEIDTIKITDYIVNY